MKMDDYCFMVNFTVAVWIQRGRRGISAISIIGNRLYAPIGAH